MESMEERIGDALRMVDAFVSVGSRHFNIMRMDINRRKRGYGAGRNPGAMRLLIPNWLPICWELHESLIIQPEKPPHGVLAQLDDLDAGQFDRVRSVALVAVETSPGNYQAWLVVDDGVAELVARLKRGAESDSRATCSGRIAGSPNCKPKYAPDFPAVRLAFLQAGRRVQASRLEELGLLPAAPPPLRLVKKPADLQICQSGNSGWPDYKRVLAGAPMKADGTPDRSRADYLWCKWALERGHHSKSVAAILHVVSEKAQEEVERGNHEYLWRTVDAAGKAV